MVLQYFDYVYCYFTLKVCTNSSNFQHIKTAHHIKSVRHKLILFFSVQQIIKSSTDFPIQVLSTRDISFYRQIFVCNIFICYCFKHNRIYYFSIISVYLNVMSTRANHNSFCTVQKVLSSSVSANPNIVDTSYIVLCICISICCQALNLCVWARQTPPYSALIFLFLIFNF